MKARQQACSRHNLQRMPELTRAQALRYTYTIAANEIKTLELRGYPIY